MSCPFDTFFRAIAENSGVSAPDRAKAENDLARCLIRPVLRGGNPGVMPTELPAILSGLIGKPVDIDIAKLRKHLSDNSIPDIAVGGTVNQDIAKVRFFVIHDTSSPEIKAASFPSNINEAGWSSNNLTGWVNGTTPTHVFVNRIGESQRKTDFKTAVRATKYESGLDKPTGSARQEARNFRTGQFVHIELIQPRRRSNPNSGFFDIAPVPGFAPKQLERLALLYVVASVRSKRWLMPVFHFSLDNPIPDAHDDPQNFDLNAWLDSVNSLLSKLRQ